MISRMIFSHHNRRPNGSGGPSVAMATYNPKTGQYATPDGHVFTQADLAAQGPPKSWKDMLPVSD
jgi:phospholipid/cholesterol/gamma-HCH transport system substrate-binding protein